MFFLIILLTTLLTNDHTTNESGFLLMQKWSDTKCKRSQKSVGRQARIKCCMDPAPGYIFGSFCTECHPSEMY